MNAGTFELLKAFIRLYTADVKNLRSVVNFIFELSNVRIVKMPPKVGQPAQLYSRDELSERS